VVVVSTSNFAGEDELTVKLRYETARFGCEH
jgi:hypothetical protein